MGSDLEKTANRDERGMYLHCHFLSIHIDPDGVKCTHSVKAVTNSMAFWAVHVLSLCAQGLQHTPFCAVANNCSSPEHYVGLSSPGIQWHRWFPAVTCLHRVCFQLYAQGGSCACCSPHASQGAFLPTGRLLELSITALELNNNSVGVSLHEVTHWLVGIVTRCWA